MHCGTLVSNLECDITLMMLQLAQAKGTCPHWNKPLGSTDSSLRLAKTGPVECHVWGTIEGVLGGRLLHVLPAGYCLTLPGQESLRGSWPGWILEGQLS